MVFPMESLEHVHSPEVDIHARCVAGPDGAAGGDLYTSLYSRIFEDHTGLLVFCQRHLIIVILIMIRGLPLPSTLRGICSLKGKD